MSDFRWKCGGCNQKVSVTAGTIFDRTRTPLTVWFAVAWRMVGDKVGISAVQVQREMEFGSIQTAWMMLHRYRSVMVRPGRDRLRGDVEVDESILGGFEPGVRGRGSRRKLLIAAAVERNPGRFGRVRLSVIPDASTASLAAFLNANVEPGSHVIAAAGRPTRLRPGAVTNTRAPPSRPRVCPHTKCSPASTGCSRS